MNVIVLTGNCVRDLDLTFNASGTAIAKGTIAVRRDYKNKQGQYESDFVNFTAIGGIGKVMAEHVRKGDKFGINGSLQLNKWEKDGKTSYFTEVLVKGFDFPSKKPQQRNDPFAGSEPADIDPNDLPFF